MDYNTYCSTVKKAADLVDQKQYEPAIAIFQAVLDSGVSDLDKALTCHNVAVVCEHMGDTETALAWYDHGIAYEEPYMRFSVREYKAAALTRFGRHAESLAMYEQLYALPYALEHEKERFWNNIAILRNPRA